jgi:hypothetical protein
MRDHQTKPFLARPELKAAGSIRLTPVQDAEVLMMFAVDETDVRTAQN